MGGITSNKNKSCSNQDNSILFEYLSVVETFPPKDGLMDGSFF